MLSVSSRDLAVALADRLNDIVPPGFVVRAQDSDLVVIHDGQVVGVSGGPTIMDNANAIMYPRENLETAVRATLSGVQDYIAEATTEPWPGSGGTQPNSDARVDDDRVQMWFGSEEAPLIRLRPIDLT
jgi:hypothetical protein